MPLHAVVPLNHPSPSSSDLPDRPLMSRILKQIATLSRSIKISSLGVYSVGRAEKLDKYCQRTSLLRVLLVSALMPVPALFLEVLVECIPLQDPARGLKANYGACLRLFITVVSVAAGSVFQLRETIKISYWKTIIIALGDGCVAVMSMIVIASIWGFPVPFCFSFIAVPGITAFVVLFLLLTKQKNSNAISLPKQNLEQKLMLIAAQTALSLVYSGFGVVFTRCTPSQRFGLLIFLPVMKLFLKHQVAQLVSDYPESIPSVVVFTVDVFNGLYSSICLQSSGTWLTSIMMILMNITFTALSTAEIVRAAKTFCKFDRKAGSSIPPTQVRRDEALPIVRRSSRLLQSAKTMPRGVRTKRDVGNPVAVKKRLSAKLLFHLEYRALVAYTEAVLPLLYAAYLSILVHLPSAKYYPHSQSLTPEQLQTTIGSIVAYAATEILSLIWLHVIVKRKLGFSLLCQLAFVLETEMEQLQGRLFVWIVLYCSFHWCTLVWISPFSLNGLVHTLQMRE